MKVGQEIHHGLVFVLNHTMSPKLMYGEVETLEYLTPKYVYVCLSLPFAN